MLFIAHSCPYTINQSPAWFYTSVAGRQLCRMLLRYNAALQRRDKMFFDVFHCSSSGVIGTMPPDFIPEQGLQTGTSNQGTGSFPASQTQTDMHALMSC